MSEEPENNQSAKIVEPEQASLSQGADKTANHEGQTSAEINPTQTENSNNEANPIDNEGDSGSEIEVDPAVYDKFYLEHRGKTGFDTLEWSTAEQDRFVRAVNTFLYLKNSDPNHKGRKMVVVPPYMVFLSILLPINVLIYISCLG